MPSSYQFALWKQESLLVRRVHCWAQGEERSMGFFGKRSTRRSIEDPDFGRITEGKAESWEGDGFQLWGGTSIQVMIDAGPEGPSAEQRSFVRSLRGDEGIRVRIERPLQCMPKRPQTEWGLFDFPASFYLNLRFARHGGSGSTWKERNITGTALRSRDHSALSLSRRTE